MTSWEIVKAWWTRVTSREGFERCSYPSPAEAFTLRSSQWSRVRDEFLKDHPCCEACGTKKDLEVHHIHPVHLFPKFELEWWNLITLCRDHHFLFGHLLDWKSYNVEVQADAAKIRKKIDNRP